MGPKKKIEKQEEEIVTAEKIRKLREILGMTQEDFAKILNVSTNSIARWEKGERPTGTSLGIITTLITAMVMGLGTGPALLGAVAGSLALGPAFIAGASVASGYGIYRLLKKVFEPETNNENENENNAS